MNSNTQEMCTKGHLGEMTRRGVTLWRCKRCAREAAQKMRAENKALGLTAEGKPRVRKPTEERFFEKVSIGDCWLWTGSTNLDGYGRFHLAETGRSALAHRWAYEFLVGEIPKGLVLDHLCRVRACVNPDHVEPVTQAENVRRGYGFCAKFRGRTACSNGHEYVEGSYSLDGKSGRYCLICARNRQYALRRRTKKELKRAAA